MTSSTAPARMPRGRTTRPAAARRTRPPHLRMVRPRRRRAPRLPFDLMVVALLAGGFLALLALNTAAAQQSFRSHQLQAESAELADREEALQTALEREAAPPVLAARALRLGMRPVAQPRYLRMPTPRPAPAPSPPPAERRGPGGGR